MRLLDVTRRGLAATCLLWPLLLTGCGREASSDIGVQRPATTSMAASQASSAADTRVTDAPDQAATRPPRGGPEPTASFVPPPSDLPPVAESDRKTYAQPLPPVGYQFPAVPVDSRPSGATPGSDVAPTAGPDTTAGPLAGLEPADTQDAAPEPGPLGRSNAAEATTMSNDQASGDGSLSGGAMSDESLSHGPLGDDVEVAEGRIPPNRLRSGAPAVEPTRIERVVPAGVQDGAAADAAVAAPADANTVAVRTKPNEPDSGHREPVAFQPLFEGWPTPRAVLVLTGYQYGYLEPCGCSGLDNQLGGLIRRDTLIGQLRAQGWPLVPIDAGNQVRRYGRQPELKFQITIEGLKMMGYQAIALGPDDLRLSTLELLPIIAPEEDQGGVFVGANAVVFDPSFTVPFRVVEVNGVKIGVTAVLSGRNRKRITSTEVTTRDAVEALTAVWPRLKQQACDVNVLIVQGSVEEGLELGGKFPGFEVVVSTGGAGEPRMQPERIEPAGNWLVEVGTKAMYVGAIGIFERGPNRLRYQRIPLDSRFTDSERMLRLLGGYQDQLKELGLAGLGLRPQPHPSGVKYAGSASCEDCHPNEYDAWKDGLDEKGGPHAHAYQTLLAPPKRAKIPRNFDPECLSCHVVGWNPQQYYPYVSGYLSQEQTPAMINVGCENCHGPGVAHVDAENGDVDVSDAELKRLQQSMVMSLEVAEKTGCVQCHDLDNSPDFQLEGAFQKYWEKIKH